MENAKKKNPLIKLNSRKTNMKLKKIFVPHTHTHKKKDL